MKRLVLPALLFLSTTAWAHVAQMDTQEASFSYIQDAQNDFANGNYSGASSDLKDMARFITAQSDKSLSSDAIMELKDAKRLTLQLANDVDDGKVSSPTRFNQRLSKITDRESTFMRARARSEMDSLKTVSGSTTSVTP